MSKICIMFVLTMYTDTNETVGSIQRDPPKSQQSMNECKWDHVVGNSTNEYDEAAVGLNITHGLGFLTLYLYCDKLYPWQLLPVPNPKIMQCHMKAVVPWVPMVSLHWNTCIYDILCEYN